ncbi:MAG: hypothetical protein ABIJ61_05155 [bacterium]
MKSAPHGWLLPAVLTLLTVSLTLGILGGCSSDATAPSSGVGEEQLAWLNQYFTDDQGAQRGSGTNVDDCPVLFDTTLVQTVYQWGSQINLVHGEERIGFSVPYMAVSEPIELTIRVRKFQAPFGKFWLFDCGPEGTVFDHPLYIQPNDAARNGSVVVLFYYNPTTGRWEVSEATGNSNPQMPVYHFSKYGIS